MPQGMGSVDKNQDMAECPKFGLSREELNRKREALLVRRMDKVKLERNRRKGRVTYC